jgi:crossover junction endodeoxyribonuclease RuvC
VTILGIDPGLGRIGYGLIRKTGSQLTVLDFGLIATDPSPTPDRLLLIHQAISQLLQTHQPDTLALERLLFTKNTTTALDVAKAVGCILLAAAETQTPTIEYSPPEVKLAVTGTGRAEKKQIQFMVAKLLGLPEPPRPDDVADALAIAITHALRAPLTQAQAQAVKISTP